MKKLHIGKINRLLVFLSQPYPFYYKGKSLAVIASVLFVCSLLFLYIFEPFVVYTPEHKMNYFWISFIHSCSPLIVIAFLSLLKFARVKEENWNIQKEILLITLFLLLVGIVQFLIRDVIYNNSNNWSWKYLIEEIRHTLLIGTLFSLTFTSLNFNRLNAKNIKKADTLNLSHYSKKNAQCPIIQINTRVKSDSFELKVNNLIFAKAVGNYVELYLKGETISKVLKRITLKELVTTLAPHPNIIKTHRSYLVNLNYLKNVTGNAQGYKLQLENCEEKIPVARNIIKAFNKKIKGETDIFC